MDHQIITELLRACISASEVLDTDAELRQKWSDILTRLAPVRIGSDGRIMEWTQEFEEVEPGHRHISHLFGLHPGTQINVDTPEFIAAARKTIDHRLAHGGGHTGWSRAWIINFYARMLDGDAAHEHLLALLRKSTLPNLFDDHPPFQIDGNFGGCAGIAEMLLQSHTGVLHILPALPSAWQRGSVTGLKARGGYELDIKWMKGGFDEAIIRPASTGTCRIRIAGLEADFDTESDAKYRVMSTGNRLAIQKF